MSVMFTGDEIIEMAVRTEETGYMFYKKAQTNAKSEKLKALFGYLADEETKHRELYAGLKGSIGEPAQGVPSDWADVGMYIQAMTDDSFFLGEAKNINLSAKAQDEKEAVNFALGFEKDTLLFFYEILNLVKPVNKPVIESIIRQEKEHIRKLAEIKAEL